MFLRCCEAYRELVRRLDGEDNVVLQPRLSIPILAPGGRSTKLSRLPGVPAPLHLSAALAGYRLLSVTERARAVAGALALRRLDPANAALDAQTLGGFLRDHGQTDAIIAALWGVVGTATLNLDPDEASLALAAKVFRTGLLDHAPGVRRRVRRHAARARCTRTPRLGRWTLPASRCCSPTERNGSSPSMPG